VSERELGASVSERPLRLCDLCGGLDDHPRHVIDGVTIGRPSNETLEMFDLSGAPATAIEQLFNPSVRVRHIDCCAAAGCPVCQATEKATEGKRGEELIKLVVSGATRDLEVPALPTSMTRPAESGA
jgi:hypothetical protein